MTSDWEEIVRLKDSHGHGVYISSEKLKKIHKVIGADRNEIIDNIRVKNPDVVNWTISRCKRMYSIKDTEEEIAANISNCSRLRFEPVVLEEEEDLTLRSRSRSPPHTTVQIDVPQTSRGNTTGGEELLRSFLRNIHNNEVDAFNAIRGAEQILSQRVPQEQIENVLREKEIQDLKEFNDTLGEMSRTFMKKFNINP